MKNDDEKDCGYSRVKWSMHFGATPKIFELAEELRGKMTAAEKIVWNILRKNEWQLNFRRQHPISIYITDFYCHKIKLAIELDGGYHENKEVAVDDDEREKIISDFGIIVLRFKNEQVTNNIETVIDTISKTITAIRKT